jgi:Skp family chaperone for outer membrane proteins
MKGMLDSLGGVFNTTGAAYGEKVSVIDTEKLIAAADRMTQLLKEEEKERQQRMAQLEESSRKLKQSTDKILALLTGQQDAQAVAQQDGGIGVFPQRDEDMNRERMTGIRQAMARGTTHQISAPRTARFRIS